MHGVDSCRVRPSTASVLVSFDAGILSTRHLLQVLDRLLDASALSLSVPVCPAPIGFALENFSIGLAAMGELALPALLPVCACVLVAANAKTLASAGRDLRQRQIGLPLLGATIVLATLASGQFLTAALMGWSIKFWHRQHRRQLRDTRRGLLPEIARQRRFARRVHDGLHVEVAYEELRPGFVIHLATGEVVPADGRLVVGQALVDESLTQGIPGWTRKTLGAPLLAGSRLIEGEVEMEVTAVGATTRAARLVDSLRVAHTPGSTRSVVNAQGEEFARSAVVPTLAMAGFGLLVGDLATASAVLRPDYATAPGMGIALERLHDTVACARQGVVVHDASAFRRLAEIDLILFDDNFLVDRPALAVEVLVTCPSVTEADLLVYAATAMRGLADERAALLTRECSRLGIVPLAGAPQYRDTVIALVHEGRTIHVSDEDQDVTDTVPSLSIVRDDRIIGIIHFRAANGSRMAGLVDDLRRREGLAVGLLSDRSQTEAEQRAVDHGIMICHDHLSSQDRADVIRSYRERGLKVAYVGDCRRELPACRAADVSISINDAETFDPTTDPAAIVLVPGRIAGLAGLCTLARAHRLRVRTVHGSTLIPNLICVAGAFFFGFSSLASVIITNIGTLGVYHRIRRRGSCAEPNSLAP